MEQIEAQGKFITQWVGKRMLVYSDNTITGSSQELMHKIIDLSIMGTYDYTGAIPRLAYDHKEETIPGNSRTDEQSDYPKLVFSTADADILEQDFTHSV